MAHSELKKAQPLFELVFLMIQLFLQTTFGDTECNSTYHISSEPDPERGIYSFIILRVPYHPHRLRILYFFQIAESYQCDVCAMSNPKPLKTFTNYLHR